MKHRDFYDKEIWKQRFLSLRNKRFLLQGIDCLPDSPLGRIQHIIEFFINSGNIVLTERDVGEMEYVGSHMWNFPHNSLTDVFTILCGTGKIQPSWNINIRNHAVYNYFKMFVNPSLPNYIPSMESRLGRLLANPATSPRDVFQISTKFFKRRLMKRIDTEWVIRVNTSHKAFMIEALEMPQMRSHLLLSDEQIISYFFRQERVKLFKELIVKFASFTKPYKDAEKAKHKLRMRQYKEGIAMAVWHPKNLERWLSIGRWPLVASIAGDDGLA